MARLYLISTELFSEENTIFRQCKNYRKGGNFQATFLQGRGGNLYIYYHGPHTVNRGLSVAGCK